jgi:hypothetical protein
MVRTSFVRPIEVPRDEPVRTSFVRVTSKSVPLDFVPLDEPRPLSGDAVALRIANPDHAEEQARHRAVLERNPFATSFGAETLPPTFFDAAELLIGAAEIAVADTKLVLVVGYPFRGQYAVAVSSSSPDGFTRAELFRNLVRVYALMYDGATYGPGKLRLQTRVDSPRFGTAWHRLEELAIEHVMIQRLDNATARVWISIGS